VRDGHWKLIEWLEDGKLELFNLAADPCVQNKLGRSVRTAAWRYAEWEDGSAMLFDHTKDPPELKNLAGDPAHATVVKEMKALLNQLPK